MSKIIVKFTRQHAKYVTGDIAGFDASTAEKLVRAKVAVPYGPEEGDPADPAETPEGTGAKAETAGKKS